MTVGIYKITNKINNKSYIGQSVHIELRLKQHKYDSKNTLKNTTLLYLAMNKYGIDNFTFEIIKECPIEELDKYEIYYIKEFNTIAPYGYNITEGGQLTGHSHYMYIDKNNIDDIIFLLKNDYSLSIRDIAKMYDISEHSISYINTGLTHRRDGETYPLREKNVAQKYNHIYYCIDCGKEVSKGTIRCKECDSKHQQRCERPSKEDLLEMIATSSFEAVGRKYGVSGNAVKKWCASYGLPIHKKEIIELYNSGR